MTLEKDIRIRDRVKELRRVRAGDLLANPRNWREHPQAQQDAMRGVLTEIGFADALLAYETPDGLMLVDGHLRAALDPDLEVPVLVLDLTEAEASKMLVTLDPLAAMAETNHDALSALLNDGATFDSEAINKMLADLVGDHGPQREAADPDAVPVLSKRSHIKLGDIYRLGPHTIECGDATESRDVTPDLTLTDPPYGISIVKGGSAPTGTGRTGGPGKVGAPSASVKAGVYHPIAGDDEPFDPAHLLTLPGVLFIFGGNHFASKLPDRGCWIVWDKGVVPASTFSDAELVWTNQEGHIRMYRHVWAGMTRAGSRDVELAQRIHPTQKPVGLLSDIINDFSKAGETVYDPYIGSGSTLIACEITGRVCYGVELEPMYVQATIKRWEDYTGQKAAKVG